jgi:hypothetical protein
MMACFAGELAVDGLPVKQAIHLHRRALFFAHLNPGLRFND